MALLATCIKTNPVVVGTATKRTSANPVCGHLWPTAGDEDPPRVATTLVVITLVGPSEGYYKGSNRDPLAPHVAPLTP